MQPADLTIEVRDATLARVGQIPATLWTDVQLVAGFNRPGSWSLTLPYSLEVAQALAQPGAGIIVTGPQGVLYSGPMTKAERVQGLGDELGDLSLSGVDDTALLWDPLAWPDPASAANAQTVAYDVRTGPAETLLHQLVNVNLGPGALSGRRGALATALTLGPNLGRGPTLEVRARFDRLGDLLAELGRLGGIGFRVLQSGSGLQFTTYLPADKSLLVRADVANGLLARAQIATLAPALTRAIVLGQGQGDARAVIARSSTASTAAETAWGRVVEAVKDRRDAEATSELEQAGDELLAVDGYTRQSINVTPSALLSDSYGDPANGWEVGDWIGVTVAGVDQSVQVRGVALGLTADGLIAVAKLED